jgi:hypothetical protein
VQVSPLCSFLLPTSHPNCFDFLTNTNTCQSNKASSQCNPGSHPYLTLHRTNTIPTNHQSIEDYYMSNHPFAPPAFGPVRGRGAFNHALHPYLPPHPSPRGRGRAGVFEPSHGRGRGRGLEARTSATISPRAPPSQPRQIRIKDVVFELDAKGSKLTRITRECPTSYTLKDEKILDRERHLGIPSTLL